MRKILSILILSIALLPAISAIAADKVVVIPLNSSKSVAGQNCSLGKFVSGFDANGDIICAYPPKYVFVTPGTYTGNLTGLDGADKICQAEANRAALGGVYKAWLSDVDNGPMQNFTRHKGDYITTTGIVVANGWADLTDGSLQNPINITSAGDTHITYVWTNTQIDGNIDTFDTHCLNWTSDQGNTYGMVGHSNFSTNYWTEYRAIYCSETFGFYCIQQ